MTSDTTNLPSPEPVVETPQDIEAASEQLKELGEGWQNLPDRDPTTGKFVKKDEVKEEVLADLPEPTDDPNPSEPPNSSENPEVVEETEPEVEEAPKALVTLKGQPERGEEDIELDVGDAALVERIQRLQNDGLRKKDYEGKLQAVQQKEAEVSEFFTALEHNPIGTVINAIPRGASLDVARALIAEHWDALLPELQQFSQDPTRVRETRLDARERSIAADKQTRSVIDAERRASAIMSATDALVPDTVAPAIRQQFIEDAERDLVKLAQQGVAVSPETVASQLQDRIRMYGFAVQSPVKPAKPAVARRVGSPDSPIAAPDVEKAKQVQARIQANAAVRKNAAAIPPAGRGPVATRKPLVPKGADIEAASDALSKADSWAAFRPI
jgi:hypothetical protein